MKKLFDNRLAGMILSLLILSFAFSISYAETPIYTVEKVVDGDTIILNDGQRVRLIGIDTPELHHPSKPVMYFAEEAYRFIQLLCEGKEVRLEYDGANIHNKHLDRYGRTLAYVYLEDGFFVNAEIVKQGYGFCYIKFPFKYMNEFREYQREAMEEEKGLWATVIHSPDVSNLIMYYEKLNDRGKETAKDYLEYLIIKHRPEQMIEKVKKIPFEKGD